MLSFLGCCKLQVSGGCFREPGHDAECHQWTSEPGSRLDTCEPQDTSRWMLPVACCAQLPLGLRSSFELDARLGKRVDRKGRATLESAPQAPQVPCFVQGGTRGYRLNWFSLRFSIILCLRLDHLCLDDAMRLGVLESSTYMDEDMVGKIKRFAMKSHPNGLGHQVLNRYAAYVCVRWLRLLEGD